MPSNTPIIKVKPGISARGYRVAIKDYNEPAVIEELAANSYDADASTVLVLLDTRRQELHILDDGCGFSKNAMMQSGMLGGGDKQDIATSESQRPYLGAYGFGLKASANIANKVIINTVSEEGQFKIELDWAHLDEALKPDFDGFDLHHRPKPRQLGTGSHIILGLKNPTSTDILDSYASALANLPQDNGKFKCYVGDYQKLHRELAPATDDFAKLNAVAKSLLKRKLLMVGDPSTSLDLKDCGVIDGKDRQDPTVKYRIYFTGIREGKVLPMKTGLRGIYVRIHGRLLKQSFTEQKYVYPISKWNKFASGIRVELSIDWLRGEISLARDSLKFSNTKLEEQFRTTVTRVVSGFIRPQLKKLEQKSEKKATKEHNQRIELANKRVQEGKDVCVPEITTGFRFIPETDGELALLIANENVMKRINSSYKLLDYNDKAPFDCLIYDAGRREFVLAELEPTLIEFLQHKNIPENLAVIITWSLGKWRVGAKKKGLRFHFQLTAEQGAKSGHYRLLAYNKASSKNPTTEFPVVVLDQILKK
ncbi:MAG: ATP-binding protein [Sedimentisphaerales bacterium]|jgi:hypothetical protein